MIGMYLTIPKPTDTPANFEIYTWGDTKATYGQYAQFAKFWDVDEAENLGIDIGDFIEHPENYPGFDFSEIDTGVQSIRIIVMHNDEKVVELYGYNIDR